MHGEAFAANMEAKNRRRQESPFTCLKPLIRVWGVATAIGECSIINTAKRSKVLFSVEILLQEMNLKSHVNNNHSLMSF